MRGLLSRLELERPTDLADALRLLAAGARPFAGGTDLMVQVTAGAETPDRFVDVSRLPELAGIAEHADHFDLGARCTYTELLEHPAVTAELPNLARAAALTGAVAIQNRGTLGGNLGNASPAADALPCLLAYDATLVLASPRGRRVVAYDRFHLGYKRLDLAPDELIARILVPRPPAGSVHFFRKVGTRQAQAIAKVNLALVAHLRDGLVETVRVALGAVAPTPVRAGHVEALLTGRPVKPTLGMTGEITLQGQVLPIGGVKQKVLAAHRMGLTEVVLPKRNGPDLDDVPENVRNEMTFHLASTYDEVLAAAF